MNVSFGVWKELGAELQPLLEEIRGRYEQQHRNFHDRQNNFIRLLRLHIATLSERVDIHISSSSGHPLDNADSIIDNIVKILEFSKRRELEYRIVTTILEFAVLGLKALAHLMRTKPASLPRRTQNRIRMVIKAALESNDRNWEIHAGSDQLKEILGQNRV